MHTISSSIATSGYGRTFRALLEYLATQPKEWFSCVSQEDVESLIKTGVGFFYMTHQALHSYSTSDAYSIKRESEFLSNNLKVRFDNDALSRIKLFHRQGCTWSLDLTTMNVKSY